MVRNRKFEFTWKTEPFGFHKFQQRRTEKKKRIHESVPIIGFSFSVLRMKAIYTGEDIHYMTRDELCKTQVFWWNFRVYDVSGKLFTTAQKITIDKRGRADGTMIVMDSKGNLFAHQKRRGVIQHSSFFQGGPLAFAGMWEVKYGRIKRVVCTSGHYHTGNREIENLKKRLLHPTIKDPLCKFESDDNLCIDNSDQTSIQ
jgi:hypothetical protein